MKSDAEMTSVAPKAATSGPSAGELSAAAGLLDRLRNGLASGPSEAPKESDPAPSLFRRLRRNLPGGSAAADEPAQASAPAGAPMLLNDLRHYLNQRLAASAAEAG